MPQLIGNELKELILSNNKIKKLMLIESMFPKLELLNLENNRI
jgi:Leucine-rich repeat (LRR) protein